MALHASSPLFLVLSWTLTLLVAHLVLGAAAARRINWRHAKCNVAQALRCSKRAVKPHAKKVAEKNGVRQSDLFRSLCVVSSAVLLVFVIIVVRKSLSGEKRSASLGHDIAMFTSSSCLLAIHACPNLTRGRTLDVTCMMLMLSAVLYESPLSSETNLIPAAHGNLLLFRLILSIACPTEFLGALLNFLSLVSNLALAWTEDPGSRERSGYTRQDVAVNGVLEYALLSAAVALMRRSLAKEVYQTVEATASRIELSAASALLHARCDAVVELDDEMKLVSNAPKLADLLLHGPDSNLQGRNFATLFHSYDDRERFFCSIQIPVGCIGPIADSGDFVLRDAINNEVRVELLQVGYRNVDESGRHLIGILEHSDQYQPRSKSNAMLTLNADNQELLFIMSMQAESFEISYCSRAFCHTFGDPWPGATIVSWLRKECNINFYAGCEQLLRAFRHFNGTHLSADVGSLELCVLSQEASDDTVYSATGTATMMRKQMCKSNFMDSDRVHMASDSSDSEGVIVIELELSDLKMTFPSDCLRGGRSCDSELAEDTGCVFQESTMGSSGDPRPPPPISAHLSIESLTFRAVPSSDPPGESSGTHTTALPDTANVPIHLSGSDLGRGEATSARSQSDPTVATLHCRRVVPV